jgi:hypothetical protein
MNKNRIASLEAFLEHGVNIFSRLKNLSLLKNPCNPLFDSPDPNKYDSYKDLIQERFMFLISLDGFPVEVLRYSQFGKEKEEEVVMERLYGEARQVKVQEAPKTVKIRSEGNRFVKNDQL